MGSSKELDETKIVRIPKLDYVPDSRGLGYVYYWQMLKHADKVAQVDTITGEKDTFSALLQRCIRTAITMRSKGVTSDDVVTICSFNHLNSCVPFISTLFLGAKVANLDPTISLRDTIHLLSQTTPKLIFVMADAVELIEKAVAEAPFPTEIVVFGNTGVYTPFDVFLQPQQEEKNFKPNEVKNISDIALITFSSGTSGLPKGICISHFAFLTQIANTMAFGYCLEVMLISTSLYWITASLFLGVSMIYGKTRLIIPRFDVCGMWDTITKYKPTYMFSAPSQILTMYNQGRPKDLNKCSLRSISIGGGPILKEQVDTVSKAFPEAHVMIVYGQTEAAGFLTTFKPGTDDSFIRTKSDSCGTIVQGFSFKIVDSETEELLGPNQSGEIRFKADCQLSGYHNLDSSDAWDSEGWIKTGDIGYYDRDHCFYVVDRIKEMLKFQAWHVPPAILEDVLLTHPAIATAVVIGIPHETDGDHPMAVVVLKNNCIGVTPKSIENFVEERVHDRQRLRAGVKIVDDVPTTPTGKIKRKEIRDMILRGEM